MTDPFLMPHIPMKVRRLCVNFLCGRRLSALNKGVLCFACHRKAMTERFEPPTRVNSVGTADLGKKAAWVLLGR